MIEARKVIVFIFVLLLLFYTSRLLYAIRHKKEKAYVFIVMFLGLFLLASATFLDLIAGIVQEQCVYDLLKLCFTGGAVLYVIGIILWSGFTKNMIADLEKAAVMDSLTGTLNRNGLEKEFEALIKNKKPFYLVVCDLDGTKLVNDTFGHMEGDKFICNTAAIMLDLIGKKGCVSRIGGDEFVILLGNSKLSEIKEIIFNIRAKISRLYPQEKAGVSIGYALFPEEGEYFEELAQTADAKMYQDKKSKQPPI